MVGRRVAIIGFGIFVAFLTYIFAPVFVNFVSEATPHPDRTRVFLGNVFADKRSPEDDRFRFVLCWFEGDDDGTYTKAIQQELIGINVDLVRSAAIVNSDAAGDEWQTEMRNGAQEVLAAWNADIAIVGVAKPSERSSKIWLVPREGDGTLHRRNTSETLNSLTLPLVVPQEVGLQLATLAFSSLVPVLSEARTNALLEELESVLDKINSLLDSTTLGGDRNRAALRVARGNALLVLGELKAGTNDLAQAIADFMVAREVYTRELAPLDWGIVQKLLGTALAVFGERETSTEHLERAVRAFQDALEVYTQEQTPLDWASLQNNRGGALLYIGRREASTEHLEQAIQAFQNVLEVYTQEQTPFDWAMAQNNLGGALLYLGEREASTEHLEQAIQAFQNALEVYTQEQAPFDWAMTQNNLGAALLYIGRREASTEHLDQAVQALGGALEIFDSEHAPVDWARAQNNLGNALTTLGDRQTSTTRLLQAIEAYKAALKVFTPREYAAPMGYDTEQPR